MLATVYLNGLVLEPCREFNTVPVTLPQVIMASHAGLFADPIPAGLRPIRPDPSQEASEVPTHHPRFTVKSPVGNARVDTLHSTSGHPAHISSLISPWPPFLLLTPGSTTGACARTLLFSGCALPAQHPQAWLSRAASSFLCLECIIFSKSVCLVQRSTMTKKGYDRVPWSFMFLEHHDLLCSQSVLVAAARVASGRPCFLSHKWKSFQNFVKEEALSSFFWWGNWAQKGYTTCPKSQPPRKLVG